jgi:hypothetical protein
VEPPAAANDMIISLHFEEVIAMMSLSGRFEQDAASRRMKRFSDERAIIGRRKIIV